MTAGKQPEKPENECAADYGSGTQKRITGRNRQAPRLVRAEGNARAESRKSPLPHLLNRARAPTILTEYISFN